MGSAGWTYPRRQSGEERDTAGCTQGIDRRHLRRAVVVVELDPAILDRLPERRVCQRAGAVLSRRPRQLRNPTLNPDLYGVGDPHPAVAHALDQVGLLPVELETALPDKANHPLDVRAALVACADQAADCPELH